MRRLAFVLGGLLAPLLIPRLPLPGQGTDWDPQAVLKTEQFAAPPANIARMIRAPRVDLSFTMPSPDQRWFLRTTGADRGDWAAYGAPHLWLGGLQVDTRANRARSLTTSPVTGLLVVDPRTGAQRALQVPAGATVSSPVWSPRGTHVAYIANFPVASFVYVADVASGKATRLSDRPLLATLATGIDFTAGGDAVAAVLVPAPRAPQPVYGANGVADGPLVRLTEGRAAPQPVHFSLLQDPHDKRLLAWHTTGQLALLDVRGKGVRAVGAPAMIRDVSPSPDGGWFRVTRMVEPFSYLVPVSSFGTVDELWDRGGTVVATLGRSPLREAGRGDAATGAPAGDSTGRRSIQWNPVGPGLLYVQTVTPSDSAAGGAGNGPSAGTPPGGPRSAGVGAPIRVRAPRGNVVAWRPPFGPGDTTVLYRGGAQLGSVLFSTDSSTLFVADSGAVIAVRLAEPTVRVNLGRGVSLPATGGFGGGGPAGAGGARGADSTAGTLVTRRGAAGVPYVVLSRDRQAVALAGTRAPGAKWHEQAPRPWVDRLRLDTRARTRLMDSPADSHEEFVAPLDDDLAQFLVLRESPTTLPDVWLRDAAGGAPRKVTANVDVGPEVSGAAVRRIRVSRPRDGTPFWVEVTLPRDRPAGARLPGIIWFYPREYSTAAEYDRSRHATNINRFPSVPSARPASSTKLWVSQGYVLIEPDIPIFGDAGRMNDNYTRDLKENLDAVIDAVVDSGWVDRHRMGIGGHSYGAFSTVNAMSLMPNFKAGIAGDGMYNRTLTPFGFQSERRNFYQAQATYLDMSPFLRADRLSGALLLYHALEDQNTGTAPLSSQRMFLALQGLGKVAALYQYPYEDHSVATYASDLDLWARWVAWMDTHVKGAKPAAAPVP